ncbi:MAG: hypothetical protein ACREM2_05410 [Vulcanimicrobiaceae bacterium]
MRRALLAAGKPLERSLPLALADPPAPWKVALALVLALALQGALAPTLGARGATLPLVALVALWYALRAGVAAGAFVGALAGLGEDALAASGVAWTIATAIVCAFAGRLRGRRAAAAFVPLIGAAALGVFARDALFAIAFHLEGRTLPFPLESFHRALVQAALGALVTFAALVLFPRLRAPRADRG